MAIRNRKNKNGFYALIISVLLHLLVLVCFAFITFSKSNACANTQKTPSAAVRRIAAIADSQPQMPKPKIKKIPTRKNLINTKTDTKIDDIFNSPSPDKQALPTFTSPQHSSDNALTNINSAKVDFFGSISYDRRICYVVDSSGSMLGLFNQLQANLKKSISQLQADQYFYIVFFGNDQTFEFIPGKMTRATSSAKKRALEFIDSIEPKGKTNALNAIAKAAAATDNNNNKPTLIYFLTDGFEITKETSNAFIDQTINIVTTSAPNAKINTIGFWVQKDDIDILETIAKKTSGHAVFITK